MLEDVAAGRPVRRRDTVALARAVIESDVVRAAHALLESDDDTLLARLVELLRQALESASASSVTEAGRHEIVQQLLHNLTMPRSARGGFNITGSGVP